MDQPRGLKRPLRDLPFNRRPDTLRVFVIFGIGEPNGRYYKPCPVFAVYPQLFQSFGQPRDIPGVERAYIDYFRILFAPAYSLMIRISYARPLGQRFGVRFGGSVFAAVYDYFIYKTPTDKFAK